MSRCKNFLGMINNIDVESDSSPETDPEDSDYENDSATDDDDIAPRKCPKGSFDMNNGVCFNPETRSSLHIKKNKLYRKSYKKSSRKSYKKPSRKSYNHHHNGNKKVSTSSTSFFENSNVIELTETTFPKDTFPMIVLFFASWCGFCKEFKPIYKELATKLKDTVTLYAVDCDENKSLASTYHITGFPTLVCITPTETKLFSDTKKDRTLENVLEWITSTTIQPNVDTSTQHFFDSTLIVEITDNDILGDQSSLSYPLPVLFYSPDCHFCKEFQPIYSRVAESLVPQKLYAINCDKEDNKQLCSIYQIQGYPTLLSLTSKPKKSTNSDTYETVLDSPTFDDSRDVDTVKKWIEDQVHSTSTTDLVNKKAYYGVETVTNKTIEVTDEFLVKEQQPGPLFIGTDWCGHCTKMKPEYNRAANENTDTDITFYIANGDTVPGLKEKFGVKGFPTLVWTEKGKSVDEKVFTGERTTENIKKWVDGNK